MRAIAYFAVAVSLCAQTLMLRDASGNLVERTLNPHPRLEWNGAGSYSARFLDPDGIGPGKAVWTSEYPTPWTRFQERLSTVRGNNPNTTNGGNDRSSEVIELAAVVCAADNNATIASTGESACTVALQILNNIEEWMPGTGAINIAATAGGTAGVGPLALNDFDGALMVRIARAYTLMRGQMSSGERTLLAQKMLNGSTYRWAVENGANCTNRMQTSPLAGHVSSVVVNGNGTRTLTGTGTSWGADMVGKWAYFQRQSDLRGTVRMAKVLSRASDTSITISSPGDNGLDTGLTNVYPWRAWEAGDCGYGYRQAFHPNFPGGPRGNLNWNQVTTLSGSLASDATTMTVAAASGIAPAAMPFNARIAQGSNVEHVVVTAVAGATWTIIRAPHGQSAQAFTSGASVVAAWGHIQSQTNFDMDWGWNNRLWTREMGLLAVSIAFAGDSDDANDLLQWIIDYYYNYNQATIRHMVGMITTAAVEYSQNRNTWQEIVMRAWMKNSFTVALDYTGDRMKRVTVDQLRWWKAPGDTWYQPQWGITFGGCYDLGGSNMTCLPSYSYIPLLYPGTTEAANALWWITNHPSNFAAYDGMTHTMLAYVTYSTPSDTRTHPTTGQNHWITARTVDDDSLGYKADTAVSFSSWNANATGLYLSAISTHCPAPPCPATIPNLNPNEKLFSPQRRVLQLWRGNLIATKDRAQLIGGSQTYGVAAAQPRGGGTPDDIWARRGLVLWGDGVRSTHTGAGGGIDRAHEEAELIAWRTSAAAQFHSQHQVTADYQDIIHFRRASGDDVIFQHDRGASSVAQPVRDSVHYRNSGNSGEGVTKFDSTARRVESDNLEYKVVTDIVSTHGNDIRSNLQVYWATTDGVTGIVAAGCSVSNPCRAARGATVYSFTAQIDVVMSGSGLLFVWMDWGDGSIHLGTTGTASHGSCPSGATCDGTVTGFPAGDILKLARINVPANLCNATETTGSIEMYYCIHNGRAGPLAIVPTESILRLGGGTQTGAHFTLVHQTAAVADSVDVVGILASSSGTICAETDGVESADPVAACFPTGTSDLTAIEFTSTASGTIRHCVGGLQDGTWARTGPSAGAGIAVSVGDNMMCWSGGAGEYTLTRSGASPLMITTTGFPAATVGAAYDRDAEAAGGTPAYSWAVVLGALPPGISLNGSTGELMGTPSSAGTYPFRLEVTDAAMDSAIKDLVIQVNAAAPTLQITTTLLPTATQGVAYSATLAASGGTPPYDWSLITGPLPAGISLSSSSGDFTGTPTEAGSFPIRVVVEDDDSDTAERNLTLTVNSPADPLSFSGAQLDQSYEVYGAVSLQLAASGGTPAYLFTASTPLPAGLSLSAGGLLTGTPTALGDFPVTVCVEDAASAEVCGSGLIVITGTGTAIAVNGRGATTSVLLTVARAGIGNSPIQVVLRAGEGVVTTEIIPAGPAVRSVLITGLTAGTAYTVEAAGGGFSGVGTVQTRAAGSTNATIRIIGSAPQGRGVTHGRLEYGGTANLGNAQTQACTAVCVWTLNRDAGPLYTQIIWAGGVEGAPVIAAGPVEFRIVQ